MRRKRENQTWQEANAWPGLDTSGLTFAEIRRRVRGLDATAALHEPENDPGDDVDHDNDAATDGEC